MTLKDLRQRFADIKVIFPDDKMDSADMKLKRAIIYYQDVRSMYESFNADFGKFKEELKDSYELISPAFCEENFLLDLCEMLDAYIVYAVNDELKNSNRTYGDLFSDQGDLFMGYPDTVNKFLQTYQGISRAIESVWHNFANNIVNACKRIITDWKDLNTVFAPNWSSLKSLRSIRSPGSDFHKGGQQVLFLTFVLSGSSNVCRIVYKPSDLEADCLIIGDTHAVNKVYSGASKFQDACLFEILNQLIKQIQHPLMFEPFPTYKILPKNPGSRLKVAPDQPFPVRDAYGYIEFLTSEEGKTPPKGDLYSNGGSDFQIFDHLQKEKICYRFGTLLGQLAAVAAVFSISDLHMENLLIHNFEPYIIDLENSLTRKIKNLADTEMCGGDSGSIDSVYFNELLRNCDDQAKSIREKAVAQRRQNRLWESPKRLIGTDEYCNITIRALYNTMDLIHRSLQHGTTPFDPWFSRLQKGVVVRVVPCGTNKFTDLLREVYRKYTKSQKRIEAELEGGMQGLFDETYLTWASKPAESPPYFLCLQSENVSSDLVNLDVPVFYHRLNSSNVMNSKGKTIAIPGTVRIKESAVKCLKWGDGSKVPPEGKALVIVGIDDNARLHIRIFDAGGKRITDTDETMLPSTKAELISTLKQELPGLLFPPHLMTFAEQAQVLSEVASITDQTWIKWKEAPVAPLIQNRNTFFPAQPILEIQNTQLEGLIKDETLSTRAKAFGKELREKMQAGVGRL